MSGRISIAITDRRSFAGGMAFGDTGPYERLVGRAHFAIDPHEPGLPAITDLSHAPIGEDGRVRYSADICILKPVEPDRGARRLLFDWGNRGNKRALQFFNDAPATNAPLSAADAGNGFLFRRGYSVVWCAWQGDILPGDGRMCLDVPVARSREGPITGLVRTEFIPDRAGITSFPLSGHVATASYPAASLDTRQATLTRRRYPHAPRQTVAPDAWAFAREETGGGLDAQGRERAIVPSSRHIHLPGGFEPGWIYELVYTARDPLVLGLGFVAVRDLVAFLRRNTDADANPLAGKVDKAYAWGRSQTGRCIRDFVYLGFNADHEGARVFDGVMPHVAGAGRMWLNHRFANGFAMAGQQYEAHYHIADRFPFSYAACTERLTGRSDAILKRPDTDPLVLHTQTATEYWQRRGSLVHTDTLGHDLPQPDTVRLYHWASSQHFADPLLEAPQHGVCQNPENVVDTSMLCRALLDALDRWASDGVPPPDSRIPRRDDGTLLTYEEWRRQFPMIPGRVVPYGVNALPALDHGPEFACGIAAFEPPRVIEEDAYPVFVPAVDDDGNEVAGVRAPMVQAPLATYTGWNLRRRGFGTGAMFEFTGSTIPFPDTAAEAAATGDPRRATLDRYRTAADYVEAIRQAAVALVADRLMLEEDVERACAKAADWGRPRHDVHLSPAELNDDAR